MTNRNKRYGIVRTEVVAMQNIYDLCNLRHTYYLPGEKMGQGRIRVTDASMFSSLLKIAESHVVLLRPVGKEGIGVRLETRYSIPIEVETSPTKSPSVEVPNYVPSKINLQPASPPSPPPKIETIRIKNPNKQ